MGPNLGFGMTGDLDLDLEALRREPLAAGLDDVERRVWRRIEDERQARRAAPAVYAVRTAAVVAALAVGAATGGATAVDLARETQEISVFSVDTELAPSTLLDHNG